MSDKKVTFLLVFARTVSHKSRGVRYIDKIYPLLIYGHSLKKIDIHKTNLANIDIDINRANLENADIYIDIDNGLLENIGMGI